MFILDEKIFTGGFKLCGLPLKWFRSVSAFLNSLCGENGVKVKKPTNPTVENPVVLSIDEEWLDQHLKDVGASYTAGDGIDETSLNGKVIAVDPDKVVMVLEAEGPDITIDGNTASGTDEPLDQTTWEAGGTSKLVKAEFTRAKAVTVNNVYYYRLFWRLCTYNPNGTRAAVSAEQGYVQVRRL